MPNAIARNFGKLGSELGFSSRLNLLLDEAGFKPLDSGRPGELGAALDYSRTGARKWVKENCMPREDILRDLSSLIALRHPREKDSALIFDYLSGKRDNLQDDDDANRLSKALPRSGDDQRELLFLLLGAAAQRIGIAVSSISTEDMRELCAPAAAILDRYPNYDIERSGLLDHILMDYTERRDK